MLFFFFFFFQFSVEIIKRDILELFFKFTKFPVAIVSRSGSKASFCISNDHMTNESRDSGYPHLNNKGYSKSNKTQRQKDICITNWGKLVLQTGAALFYYKLGQMLLQIGAATTN